MESTFELKVGSELKIGEKEYFVVDISDDKAELSDGTLFTEIVPIQTILKRLGIAPEGSADSDTAKAQKPAEASVKPVRKGQKVSDDGRLVRELRRAYDSWETLFQNGGSDPFWADGVNLNICRNHILYWRAEIIDTCADFELPEIMNRPVPEQVPCDYMVNPDKIREDAKKSLLALEENPDFQFIRDNIEKLTDKEKKIPAIFVNANIVDNLRNAIILDRLIEMRRYRDPSRYLAGLSACRTTMEKILDGHELIVDDEEEEEETC